MHVAVTYDGTTIRLYVDGVQNASGVASFAINANDLPLAIADLSNLPTDRYFQGAMDDVRLYHRALSPAEIAALANPVNQPPTVNAGPDQNVTLPGAATLSGIATDDGLPSPGTLSTTWSKVSGPGTVTFADASILATTATFSAAGTYVLRLSADDSALQASDELTVTVNPDLIGWWKADDGSGSTLSDASGLGNDATTAGNPTWITGRVGGAIRFDGTGDYATVADNATLDITDQITMSAWIRPEKAALQDLLSKADGSPNGYELYLSGGGKGLRPVQPDLPGGLDRLLPHRRTDLDARGRHLRRHHHPHVRQRGPGRDRGHPVRHQRQRPALRHREPGQPAHRPVLPGGHGRRAPLPPGPQPGGDRRPGHPRAGPARADRAGGRVHQRGGSSDPAGRCDRRGRRRPRRHLLRPSCRHPVGRTLHDRAPARHPVLHGERHRRRNYDAQTQWIVEQQAALNIAFSGHTGDLVDEDLPDQWVRASAAQAVLDQGGVRNGVAAGNHDMGDEDFATYEQTFPPSRYQGFAWYGGYLGDPTDTIPDFGV